MGSWSEVVLVCMYNIYIYVYIYMYVCTYVCLSVTGLWLKYTSFTLPYSLLLSEHSNGIFDNFVSFLIH